MRRSLMPLTAKLTDEHEHECWLLLGSDPVLPSIRNTSFPIVFSMCKVVRSAAHLLTVWVSDGNQMPTKVLPDLNKWYKAFSEELKTLQEYQDMVNEGISQLTTKLDNSAEDNLNEEILVHLQYYSKLVSIASALRTGVCRCTETRLRKLILGGPGQALKGLYNGLWNDRLNPLVKFSDRVEMFDVMVLKNKENHRKITQARGKLEDIVAKGKFYCSLYSNDHLISEATAMVEDSRKFTAVASVLNVTLWCKNKIEPREDYDNEWLKGEAAKSLATVKTNLKRIDPGYLEEYWQILPEEKPESKSEQK